MSRLSFAALVAAGIFAIYSAPSFAAAATVPPKPKDPPCTVNCVPPGGGDEPTSPGDPFIPGDPDDGPEDGDPGDDPKDPGDDPKDPGDDPKEPGEDPKDGLSKSEVAQLNACLVRLDGLPPVSASDIRGFSDPSKVTLTPICEQKGLTETAPVLIEKSNVIGLEGAIKANQLMKTKLGQTAYKAHDVVGLDFDADGNAILFVHKRG